MLIFLRPGAADPVVTTLSESYTHEYLPNDPVNDAQLPRTPVDLAPDDPVLNMPAPGGTDVLMAPVHSTAEVEGPADAGTAPVLANDARAPPAVDLSDTLGDEVAHLYNDLVTTLEQHRDLLVSWLQEFPFYLVAAEDHCSVEAPEPPLDPDLSMVRRHQVSCQSSGPPW